MNDYVAEVDIWVPCKFVLEGQCAKGGYVLIQPNNDSLPIYVFVLREFFEDFAAQKNGTRIRLQAFESEEGDEFLVPFNQLALELDGLGAFVISASRVEKVPV